jgi:hypothetical protein
MYHTTGFTKAEITELCARIEARELSPRMRRWPPILGELFKTLSYGANLSVAPHLKKSRDTPRLVIKEQRLS